MKPTFARNIVIAMAPARSDGEPSVMLIPGYTSSMDMYGEHVAMLAVRGYHVMGLDLRGQGGSDRHFPKQPETLWVEDFSVYSDDLAGFIKSQNLMVKMGLLLKFTN